MTDKNSRTFVIVDKARHDRYKSEALIGESLGVLLFLTLFTRDSGWLAALDLSLWPR